jgi:hypothetical protein
MLQTDKIPSRKMEETGAVPSSVTDLKVIARWKLF